MTDTTDIRNRLIYHFTHLDNLGPIVRSGFLVCDHDARRGTMCTEVGDTAIKQTRRGRTVPVDPGGTVGDYVPFYYGPRSPMMYRIACDCRDSVPDRYQDGDRPLVYLASWVSAPVDSGLRWVGCDGNAASRYTVFTTNLAQLDDWVDWDLMQAPRWHDTDDDSDRMRRRMAEFLVHGKVPIDLFHGLATYDDDAARCARDTLGDHPLAERVIVRPQWYYGYERR